MSGAARATFATRSSGGRLVNPLDRARRHLPWTVASALPLASNAASEMSMSPRRALVMVAMHERARSSMPPGRPLGVVPAVAGRSGEAWKPVPNSVTSAPAVVTTLATISRGRDPGRRPGSRHTRRRQERWTVSGRSRSPPRRVRFPAARALRRKFHPSSSFACTTMRRAARSRRGTASNVSLADP